MRKVMWAVMVMGLVVAGSEAAVAQSKCGNGKLNGNEVCDGAKIRSGQSCENLGFTGGVLACTATCTIDTSGCTDGGGGAGALPATGQTTAFPADKNDGIGGAVGVPDDGTLQVGAPLSYTDNGDGTITDDNTGLMWEKKSDDGSLHDQDNVYRWSGDGSQETIWDWLEDINAEGGTGFAGHNDWRIPNKKELESIVDAGRFSPSIDPAFNTACIVGCTVLTCSCTVSSSY